MRNKASPSLEMTCPPSTLNNSSVWSYQHYGWTAAGKVGLCPRRIPSINLNCISTNMINATIWVSWLLICRPEVWLVRRQAWNTGTSLFESRHNVELFIACVCIKYIKRSDSNLTENTLCLFWLDQQVNALCGYTGYIIWELYIAHKSINLNSKYSNMRSHFFV